MKDKLTSLIIILLFILMSVYLYTTRVNNHVLEIVTPTVINVDVNGNNLIEENETFCIPELETFTANIKLNSEKLANDMGLTFAQSLTLGYLADEFANKTLAGKIVKIKPVGEKTPNCEYADLIIDNQSYTELFKDSGFAITENKPVNEEKFNNLLQKAEKLDLVILNHHSGKYHTLDCKYGKAARDSVILPAKEISGNYKACQFCHVDKHKHNKKLPNDNITENNIAPPPNIITDGNIQLILTDFTTILKPDRNCSHQICKTFLDSIKSSKTSIDIASYGWANIPAINKAFEDALKRGVNIRIVYDTDSKNSNYYSETDSFLEKFQNTRSDKIKDNPKLTNMLMHNKFAVFDNSKVYTGSMNFSTTGFSGFNHNNVIIINSKQIAELYTKEFNKMYEGNFHTLKIKSENNTDIYNSGSNISIYFSPQDKEIINGIIPLIKQSKKYIYIPTFILTHNTLKNELISAFNRGVDVKIIIDATNTYGKHSVFKELRAAGIPVKVENYAGKMHSKTLIIDDEYIVVGSANLSNSAENKNDENTLIIKNSRLAIFYKDFFNYLWAKIPDKYLKQTVRAESKDSIGSCYDGVDNNFDGKIDNQDTGCKK